MRQGLMNGGIFVTSMASLNCNVLVHYNSRIAAPHQDMQCQAPNSTASFQERPRQSTHTTQTCYRQQINTIQYNGPKPLQFTQDVLLHVSGNVAVMQNNTQIQEAWLSL